MGHIGIFGVAGGVTLGAVLSVITIGAINNYSANDQLKNQPTSTISGTIVDKTYDPSYMHKYCQLAVQQNNKRVLVRFDGYVDNSMQPLTACTLFKPGDKVTFSVSTTNNPNYHGYIGLDGKLE